MDEASRIAAKLSAAQKDALRGRFSWPSFMDQDDGEHDLHRLGLWEHGKMTPLGLAVRQHLMEAGK